jgi:hypothetical protein
VTKWKFSHIVAEEVTEEYEKDVLDIVDSAILKMMSQ